MNIYTASSATQELISNAIESAENAVFCEHENNHDGAMFFQGRVWGLIKAACIVDGIEFGDAWMAFSDALSEYDYAVFESFMLEI